jgi:hypothetical protein
MTGRCRSLSGPHVAQIEPLGQGHVELDRAALPGPAQGVLDVDVDLGAVEGAVALVDLVFPAVGVRAAEARPWRVPTARRCRWIFSAGWKAPGETPGRRCRRSAPPAQHPENFAFDLVRGHEDVGVVLVKGPHPEQPGKHAAELVAVHQPDFPGPQGQVPVGVGLASVTAASRRGSSWA